MNKELILSIVVAVVGTLGAYFACNLFIGDIGSETVNTIDSSVTADLASPDIEVFNYKALNPTVETYIGECSEYNEYGECIDDDNAVNIQTDSDGNIIDVNTSDTNTIDVDIETDTNIIPNNSNNNSNNRYNTNTNGANNSGNTTPSIVEND